MRVLRDWLGKKTKNTTTDEAAPLLVAANQQVVPVREPERLQQVNFPNEVIGEILSFLPLAEANRIRLFSRKLNAAFGQSPECQQAFFEKAFSDLRASRLTTDKPIFLYDGQGNTVELTNLNGCKVKADEKNTRSLIAVLSWILRVTDITNNDRQSFYRFIEPSASTADLPVEINRHKKEVLESQKRVRQAYLALAIGSAATLLFYLWIFGIKNVGELVISTDDTCDVNGNSLPSYLVSCDTLRQNPAMSWPPVPVYSCLWNTEAQWPMSAVDLINIICNVGPACMSGWKTIFGGNPSSNNPADAPYPWTFFSLYCADAFGTPMTMLMFLCVILMPIITMIVPASICRDELTAFIKSLRTGAVLNNVIEISAQSMSRLKYYFSAVAEKTSDIQPLLSLNTDDNRPGVDLTRCPRVDLDKMSKKQKGAFVLTPVALFMVTIILLASIRSNRDLSNVTPAPTPIPVPPPQGKSRTPSAAVTESLPVSASKGTPTFTPLRNPPWSKRESPSESKSRTPSAAVTESLPRSASKGTPTFTPSKKLSPTRPKSPSVSNSASKTNGSTVTEKITPTLSPNIPEMRIWFNMTTNGNTSMPSLPLYGDSPIPCTDKTLMWGAYSFLANFFAPNFTAINATAADMLHKTVAACAKLGLCNNPQKEVIVNDMFRAYVDTTGQNQTAATFTDIRCKF